jgi:histidinol dehydrogenase
MQQFTWKYLNKRERLAALQRPESSLSPALSDGVRATLNSVRKDGDSAVLKLTETFDRVTLSQIEVTQEEKIFARAQVKEDAKMALIRAIKQIEMFHKAQMPKDIRVETSPGIVCEKTYRAIEAVGLYVPGGVTPLPSTVLMLGIPARLAGCQEVVLCTPPSANGQINPNLLLAAELVGVTRIFKIGGAQAIAAMAFGTESLPKVDKIFGPGNAWVTEAKQQVAHIPGGAAIDMPAGPSEVMVVADRASDAEFVAWDLLSQAEHGVDSQVILVTEDESVLDKVRIEIEKALSILPRKDTAIRALEHARFFLVDEISEAFDIVNQYAPEHLILQVDQPNQYRAMIRNAGSVFLGSWSPESVGDYASGTNHVLPTYGYAKAFGGLSVESFMKSMTFQELSREGLEDIGATVETLAALEALDAHRMAVVVRRRKI